MTPYFENLIGLIGQTKPVIFSKFDIRIAFHQLKLSNRAKEVCSFSTFIWGATVTSRWSALLSHPWVSLIYQPHSTTLLIN